MSTTTTPLSPGNYYHIFNRGINGEPLFQKPQNYIYFLNKYSQYVTPYVETFAYCLLKNHFHFLIRIKSNLIENKSGQRKDINVSHKLSHLFNCYAQSFNKAFSRTGSLFERPFRRKEIQSDEYLYQLLYYIHLNPCKHKITDDYANYQYSSYRTFLSDKPTRLQRDAVLDWFGGVDTFVDYHRREHELVKIRHLLLEE